MGSLMVTVMLFELMLSFVLKMYLMNLSLSHSRLLKLSLLKLATT